MTKLHEIIAVEGDVESVAKKVIDEGVVTFTKKPDHFNGQQTSLKMFKEEDRQQEVAETKDMVDTVKDKLAYIFDQVAKHYDLYATKGLTNTKACADIVVDGTTLASDVPATVLLGMESQLKQIRALIEAAPTLAPGVPWQPATTRGAGVYETREPDVRMKTVKTVQHKILVAPTDKHPAQIEKWTEDLPVGKYEVHKWSGMLSPAEKSLLLSKTDNLIRSVKKARQRANNTEVVELPLGKRLLDYILS
jgi:hypothetical protein